MISNIKKIVKQDNKRLVFNQKGRLVELSAREFRVFHRYGEDKRFPQNLSGFDKGVLELLCGLELIEYEDYQPKAVTKEYSNKLYNLNSENPMQAAPFLAHLAVTSACNMACRYCSVRKAHRHTEELSTDQWKSIIKELSDAGVFQIGFTGGEPTLRKDIHELMRYTEKLGCVCNLTTNGWFLTENFVKEMAQTGIKQCQVSLDSFNPSIHDKLRGEGSCERVKRAIRLLQKYKIAVGLDTVVSKNNMPDIMSLIIESEKQGIEYVTIIKLKKGDLDDTTFKQLVPTYQEYGLVIEKLCERHNVNPNVTIDCGSVANLQYTLKSSELHSIPTAGCPIGHNLICIAPNGDIFPCAALMTPKFKLGNMLEDDFSEVWKNHVLLRRFRKIKSLIEGKCRTCERLDFCRGGCRGIAHSLSPASIFSSDSSCSFKEG
jgi:radical SAM protein with 4Fe4S-binding SPASM domain